MAGIPEEKIVCCDKEPDTAAYVDFDKVEPSNLNRQHYMVSHLGMRKTDAVRDAKAIQKSLSEQLEKEGR